MNFEFRHRSQGILLSIQIFIQLMVIRNIVKSISLHVLSEFTMLQICVMVSTLHMYVGRSV